MAVERNSRLRIAQAAIDEMLKDEVKRHAMNRQVDRTIDLEERLRNALTFHATVDVLLLKVFGAP